MLGRLRRTTRLDVGLALVFIGLAFLVWSLVAGVSRWMMQCMVTEAKAAGMELPNVTKVVSTFFVDLGFLIDVAGLCWMLLGLVLVFVASRQRIGISWAWMCGMLQAFIAGLGAVLVGVAVYLPYRGIAAAPADLSPLVKLSRLSLPVILAVAILVWVVFLAVMLVDRARLNRRGPTLTDGLRTNRK